jgi:TetR/AcrR family transcriptional repressor of mexJK operon
MQGSSEMSNGSATGSRKDRKRAEIVAIARDLIFKEGYAGTSMSQIAATVGGSKTTLYNYFQSKEELLLAVVQDVVVPKAEDYDRITMPSDFRAWLVWFGRSTMKRITSYNYISLQRLAAAEALRFPEIGRLFDEVGIKPGYEMITQSFADAMDAGILRRADPLVAVEQFLEMCSGWTLRRAIWNIRPAPTDAEIEKNVSDAVSTFMDGYAPRNGAESVS